MTTRLAARRELAEEKVTFESIDSNIYWDLERGVSPVPVLLPWFPSAVRKTKINAIKELYIMFYNYIEARRDSPVPNLETFDMLLIATIFLIVNGC